MTSSQAIPAVETHDADRTRAVAAALAAVVEPGDTLLLAGDLGAGKTTFAQGLVAGLGIDARVLSPTFTLAHEYAGTHGGRPLRVVHADVYRLDTAHEVLDLGLDDLGGGDPDTVLLVEWGDVAAGVLPGEHLEVRLEVPADADPDTRRITWTPTGPSWAARADRLCGLLAEVRT